MPRHDSGGETRAGRIPGPHAANAKTVLVCATNARPICRTVRTFQSRTSPSAQR